MSTRRIRPITMLLVVALAANGMLPLSAMAGSKPRNGDSAQSNLGRIQADPGESDSTEAVQSCGSNSCASAYDGDCCCQKVVIRTNDTESCCGFPRSTKSADENGLATNLSVGWAATAANPKISCTCGCRVEQAPALPSRPRSHEPTEQESKTSIPRKGSTWQATHARSFPSSRGVVSRHWYAGPTRALLCCWQA